MAPIIFTDKLLVDVKQLLSSKTMFTQPAIIYNPVTRQQLTFVATSQQELIIEASYGTGSKEPLPHYHPMQEEYFEVISGQLTVRLNNQLSTLHLGDTLRIPLAACIPCGMPLLILLPYAGQRARPCEQKSFTESYLHWLSADKSMQKEFLACCWFLY
ncbi:cupin domain-containing protein [Hymenobacter volaticus]|uniref:Cupin domain-containing protein n=1 Tax=Hymenobacter volaticus TaxID=2932254 RepID=A0ABY4GCH0_9BACT|nr:cupin domain-containing protein [Hymenobacter volaticus]UOQ68601.1 cupin domain-containing protein [Hymenobacter volaticus]